MGTQYFSNFSGWECKGILRILYKTQACHAKNSIYKLSHIKTKFSNYLNSQMWIIIAVAVAHSAKTGLCKYKS